VHVIASAPTRIDFAGGTIDIWPLYLFHEGAVTVNTALALRAHVEIEPRMDGQIEIVSVDTGRRLTSPCWSSLDGATSLPLLSLMGRHYRLANATLTTRSEAPAGAGIAGSSALALATCAALARWSQAPEDPEHLLQVTMNIECQTIRVPAGVQDYRPALYGGTSAVELGVDGVRRRAIDVDPRELESRLVLAYTGVPRNSGTNNWEIMKRHLNGDRDVFDRFERIRDAAAALRDALERADWDEAGVQIARDWETRKELAPGVTTPAIDDLMARAARAGATAGKVCGAGGGGCLFCYGPPSAKPSIAEALANGGAQLLDVHLDMEGLRVG
jgi:D-glycero-alpha-D-manno-heptose-7-phosphate kinase